MKKKKENKLSLWKLSYRKSYYWTHPLKWIKDVYWNIRNFIHRGQYGFAYSDVWGWYYWWPTVGAEALRYLMEHHSAYPGYEPFETPEKWEEYLRKIIENLEWCVESCEPGNHSEEQNCYKKAYDAQLMSPTRWSNHSSDSEDSELIKKYWDRELELEVEDTEKRSLIFSEIGKELGRFWD
ncbi:MAG: hypothetical protein LIR46_12820 [Bacteroidota bacterium]|nr:hypothetical protein [Bacteroidota bacterium]